MLWLLLGGAVLFVMLGGMKAFEQASVPTIKALLAWISTFAGIALIAVLVLTGREASALWCLALFAPAIYQRWDASKARRAGGERPGTAAPRASRDSMTRKEAYAVLGLAPGATESDIREAHRRLMRTAHPDTGGSDWLATRINQARDVLLG